MKFSLKITTPDLDPEVIKEEIRLRVEKLDQIYDRIMSCRVVVESPHHHRQKGTVYDVRIDAKVPGSELVVNHQSDKDIHVAIRDAFDAIHRKLEDFSRRQHGDTKHHEEVPYAYVSALFSEEGYGFITTSEGREIYFHRNSVLNNDFNHMRVGAEVRFVEEQGEKGPQASTVTLIKK